MPCLRIETNVAKSDINVEEFSAELTAAVAKTLSKPISYCMVVIVPDTLLVNILRQDFTINFILISFSVCLLS